MKRALSYLAELLKAKGYELMGIVRNPMSLNSARIKQELDKEGVFIETMDIPLTNYKLLREAINDFKPDEIYHLAASHYSAEKADIATESNIFIDNISATSNILDICYNDMKGVHIVTAGSCLMYDATMTDMQSEETAFSSNSYYGIAKITENMLVEMFRARGLYACMAILYNHESHRRSDSFVTRKIVKNMVKVAKGEQKRFTLGTLDAKKDWGFAGDYVHAMYLMANQDAPQDYILSTGILHTIGEFVEECAKQLNIDNWRDCVDVDSSIIVRKNAATLRGNNSLAEQKLGWKVNKSFKDIISEMINEEM